MIDNCKDFSLNELVDFTLRAFGSTKEDRAIHGDDQLVSNPEVCMRVLQAIKKGNFGKSNPDFWKVALVDGKIAGLIVSFIPKIASRPKHGVIGQLAVSHEFRGRGIASNLISKTHKLFRSENCKYGFVGTPITNIGAIKLYEKFGYEIIFRMSHFVYI
ncbi:MAG: GNAT family N-acetyltransferase [Candidatus Heimdallarchaeota archaeon]